MPEDGPDLTPVLGVGAPALAGALWAVENGAASAARRRDRAADASARAWPRRFPVTPGVGPFAWLELAVAEELAARRDLRRAGNVRGATSGSCG